MGDHPLGDVVDALEADPLPDGQLSRGPEGLGDVPGRLVAVVLRGPQLSEVGGPRGALVPDEGEVTTRVTFVVWGVFVAPAAVIVTVAV